MSAVIPSHTTFLYSLSLFRSCLISFFFFFNDTATTEIYTLSLHDALPICSRLSQCRSLEPRRFQWATVAGPQSVGRSEEHTSELQSHSDLVCRLLLEKKNKMPTKP